MRISDWSSDVCSSDLAVGDEFGAVGGARHAQPRLGQLAAARRIIAFENRAGIGVDDDADAERLRHRVDGDVVVRRADAAGGEDIVVARANSVHRSDALPLEIAPYAPLPQATPPPVAPMRTPRPLHIP